jgi:hypothetical protein
VLHCDGQLVPEALMELQHGLLEDLSAVQSQEHEPLTTQLPKQEFEKEHRLSQALCAFRYAAGICTPSVPHVGAADDFQMRWFPKSQ